MNYRTWIEISASSFNNNIAYIKRCIGSQKIVLSVASNAYGHGLESIARLAEANPDIFALCTTRGDEALFLKNRGIQKSVSTDCENRQNLYSHDMVHAGMNVYGLLNSFMSTTQPLLTWKTRVMQIKHIEQGVCVGYACTYTTTRPTLIAVLPIGYWDGYARGLSNNSFVVIKQCLAPVLGIVSMNLIVVDITDIPDVQVDDEVILLGNYSGVTVDDFAQRIGMINVEVIARINPTIPRIIVP